MSEKQFWHLTLCEYDAHLRLWERAHGVKPQPTKAELEQYGKNQAAILAAQVRVHNKQVEERRAKAERAGMKLVGRHG